MLIDDCLQLKARHVKMSKKSMHLTGGCKRFKANWPTDSEWTSAQIPNKMNRIAGGLKNDRHLGYTVQLTSPFT